MSERSNSERALEPRLPPDPKLAKAIRSNNEILAKSRYHAQSISPQKSIDNGKLNGLNLNFGYTEPEDISIRSIIEKGDHIQPFLPFLNQKKRRDGPKSTRKNAEKPSIYKTADVPHDSYIKENRTNKTTVSIHEDLKPINMNSLSGGQEMNNTFVASTTSNYSRFFEDFF